MLVSFFMVPFSSHCILDATFKTTIYLDRQAPIRKHSSFALHEGHIFTPLPPNSFLKF